MGNMRQQFMFPPACDAQVKVYFETNNEVYIRLNYFTSETIVVGYK